jgi:UDP:flavonoid glycosyltransferase YjiC (YdhE family)
MRILIPALGSRGDVQPYVNLCQALAAAGHEALLATNPTLGPVVQEFGVPFFPVGEPLDLGAEAARIMARSGRNWMRGFLKILALGHRMTLDASREVLDLARSVDLVVVTDCGSGRAEAESLGHRFCTVTLQPRRIPDKEDRSGISKRVAALGWRAMMPMMTAPVNRHRRSLGLEPFLDLADMIASDLALLPVSPVVVPPRVDWKLKVCQTGYWNPRLSANYQGDPSLLEFLAAGVEPIVISLGVMSLTRDEGAKAASGIILEAIRKTGLRAVVLGWDGLVEGGSLGKTLFMASSVPHAWLLQRARAVIHHGGFGTTASALTAGKPALVIPHLIDQFEWGRRVRDLGAGPSPLARFDLSAGSFEEALRDLLENVSYSEAAESIGRKLRAEEDGATEAARLIGERFGPVIPMPSDRRPR